MRNVLCANSLKEGLRGEDLRLVGSMGIEAVKDELSEVALRAVAVLVRVVAAPRGCEESVHAAGK